VCLSAPLGPISSPHFSLLRRLRSLAFLELASKRLGQQVFLDFPECGARQFIHNYEGARDLE